MTNWGEVDMSLCEMGQRHDGSDLSEQFAGSLELCTALEILDLSSNMLQQTDFSLLWPNIGKLANLRELKLRHNHIQVSSHASRT